MQINLFDSNFVGQSCSVATQVSRHIEYVRGKMEWPGITLFTDRWMFDPVVSEVKSRTKIGWLHEGKELHPENYAAAPGVLDRFDYILTYDETLLKLDPRFIQIIRGGSWVPLSEWRLAPKSRLVSMILSDKHQTSGHRLRWEIADRWPSNTIDYFGARGQKFGTVKAIPYESACFAIVVEACRENNFFSEHLLDALAFGTIPVYWGCPNIGDYFSRSGFLCFETPEELAEILPRLNEHVYEGMRASAEWNLREAMQYRITEDWLYEHFLKDLS